MVCKKSAPFVSPVNSLPSRKQMSKHERHTARLLVESRNLQNSCRGMKVRSACLLTSLSALPIVAEVQGTGEMHISDEENLPFVWTDIWLRFVRHKVEKVFSGLTFQRQ
ncbi:hypothetical protein BaRGS_00021244 [Batillaria attramentaria]|uniref:Uncharacterized protein n=1 Tax=Batillaria attramentaria TaxID=370345 RepID=A0ABD0KKN6_9CAEN